MERGGALALRGQIHESWQPKTFPRKVKAAVTCFVGLPWPRVIDKLLLS